MITDTKDILFDFLRTNDDMIRPLLDHKRYEQIVDTAIDNCKSSISLDSQNLEIISTGLLHYILTKSMMPSQRKTSMNGIDMDIVIPGLRELRYNSQNALVIVICCDTRVAGYRLAQTGTIQPTSDNIWLLTQDTDTSHARTYSIYQKKPDLGDMIHDMIKFVKSHRHNRLGITGGP